MPVSIGTAGYLELRTYSREKKSTGLAKSLSIQSELTNNQTKLLFEDESSFRQDSTLHRTWSRKGYQPLVPVTGQRASVKLFGCVDAITSKFIYNIDEVFNVPTYLNFMEYMATEMFEKNKKVHYIQDNASYHKSPETWRWFKKNRKWIEVHNLPPYCPELNAAESLWKFIRQSGTHNKCFESKEHLQNTLLNILDGMYDNSKVISGYMAPFL